MANVGSVSMDLVLGTEKFDNQMNKSFSKIENASNKAAQTVDSTINKALERANSTIKNTSKSITTNITSNFTKAAKNNEKVILASNKNITSSFASMAKKVSALLLSVFAIRKIINFGKECINLGSNLIEVQNIVDVAFGSMSKDIDDWAKNSIKNMGMSEKEAKQMAGVFGSMAKSVGFSVGESAEMSKTLTQLSADIASFYNIDYDKAYEKVKSVFTFESKPMKELGVLINDTTLNQFALEKGLNKTTKQMTMQEKVALRYQLVLERLAHVSGDFRRTEKTWANQTRILSQQLEKLKTTIGQGLVNALTPVIYYINVLVEKLQVLGDKFMEFSKKTFGDNLGKMGGILQQVSDANADEALESVGEEAEKSSKALKKTAFGFDELNKLNAPDSNGGGSSVEEIEEETKANKENNDELDKEETTLDRILAKAKHLKDMFMDGFNISLKATGFQESIEMIKTNWGKIKDQLGKVFDSKLADAFANSLGKVAGAITGVAAALGAGVLGGLNKYLEENGEWLNTTFIEILENVGNYFEETGKKLSNFFKSEDFQNFVKFILEVVINPIVRGLKFLSEHLDLVAKGFGIFLTLKAIFGIFNTLGTVIGIVTKALGLLSPVITIVHGAFTLLGGAISFLLSPIGLVVAALVGLGIVFANLYKTNEEFREKVNETWDNLKNSIVNVWETYIKPSIEAFIISIKDLADSIVQSYNTYIKPIFDEFVTLIVDVVHDYVEPLLESCIVFIGKLVDALTQLWVNVLVPCLKWIVDTLFKTIKWVWDNTKGIIETAVEFISIVIKSIIDFLSGLIDFLVGVFTGDIDKCFEGLKEMGKALYDFFHDGILKFDEFIEQTGLLIWEFIEQTGLLIWEFIKTSVTKIVEFFKNIWDTGIQNTKDHMNAIHDWFVEKFTKIKDDFCNFGKNIIDGFIGGIKDTWEKAKDTVGELADGIKDKFKDLLGIHSPSRVFKEFGRYLDEGLEIGIKTNADDIYSQVSSLSDNIQSNFTPRLAFLGKEESSSNTSQITYPDGASSSSEAVIMQQNARIIELLEAINNKENDVYMDTTKVGKLVTKYQQNESRRLS